jgi:hypothetical protein
MPKKPYPPIEPQGDSLKEPAPAAINSFPTGLMADNGYCYPSKEELQNIFASSCVEAVSRKLNITPSAAYRRMKRVELFRDLIYPSYEALHSQSREVVTADIIQALQIRETKLKEVIS